MRRASSASSGTIRVAIVAVNADAAKNPAIVNGEPYGKGWLFKLKVAAPREADVLMNAGDYEKFLASEAAHGSH